MLFCGCTHRVKKLVLRTNPPDHPAFNAYSKCSFRLQLPDSQLSPTASNPQVAGPFLHDQGYLYDAGSPVASSDQYLGVPTPGAAESIRRYSQDAGARESMGQGTETAHNRQGAGQSDGRSQQQNSIESSNAAPERGISRDFQESQDPASHRGTSGGASAVSPASASLPVPMDDYIPAGACLRQGQTTPHTETLPDAAASHMPHTWQGLAVPSHQQAPQQQHPASDDLLPGDPRGTSFGGSIGPDALQRAAEKPGIEQAAADVQGSDAVQHSYQARQASVGSRHLKPVGWDGDDWGWGVDGLTGLGIPAKGSATPQPHADNIRDSADLGQLAGNAPHTSDAARQHSSGVTYAHASRDQAAEGVQDGPEARGKPETRQQAGAHGKGDFPDILNLGGDLLQQVGLSEPIHLSTQSCRRHKELRVDDCAHPSGMPDKGCVLHQTPCCAPAKPSHSNSDEFARDWVEGRGVGGFCSHASQSRQSRMPARLSSIGGLHQFH